MNNCIRFAGRFLKAFAQWPLSPSCIENPKLIMTLLVKNEEDKLEENLRFHHAMGVDGFIITDNNSTDHTPEIIDRYKKKGWVLEYILETSTGYEQKMWVDRMIQLAIAKYSADWVINVDADELWYSPAGNLKHSMGKCRSRVLRCRVMNMYPQENAPFYAWNKRVVPVQSPEQYDLSPYSVFNRQNVKVAHRATGYLQISMGNHRVKTFPNSTVESDIVVYHYCVGTRDAFIRKMVNGGVELEKHKGRHGGRHWRYFYRLHQQGLLNKEYDRVIGTAFMTELADNGHIVIDDTISRFFKENIGV